MSTHKRENVVNLVAGVAAVLLCALLIGVLSLESSSYESDAAHHSADYVRDAEREISHHCFGASPRDYAACVKQGQYAERQEQREEENLAAQRVTAWWNWITGAAAIAGVVLSAFGVFLVYRTFRAARESNDIARETLTAENRAWIEVELSSLGDLRYHEGSFQLTVKFNLRNIGKSVALDVVPHVALIAAPSLANRAVGETSGPLADLLESHRRAPKKLLSQNIFPGRETLEQEWGTSVLADTVNLTIDGGEPTELYPLSLVIGARYNTVFDGPDDVHETVEIFNVRRDHESMRGGLVVVGRQDVPRGQLRLMRSHENLGIVT